MSRRYAAINGRSPLESFVVTSNTAVRHHAGLEFARRQLSLNGFSQWLRMRATNPSSANGATRGKRRRNDHREAAPPGGQLRDKRPVKRLIAREREVTGLA